MKIFVCKICGEVYIGSDIPKTCPFCGVANKYLCLSSVWKDENNVELTEISRKNLEEALKLELSNTSFYECAAKKLENMEVAKMFKGLFKVEREHASVFKKILKLEIMPEINEECSDNALKIIEESYAREDGAIKFYTKALAEATEERVKEVFKAIMDTEKDHLELDMEMKKKFE